MTEAANSVNCRSSHRFCKCQQIVQSPPSPRKMGQMQENVNLAFKLHHSFSEKQKQMLPENKQKSGNEVRNLEIISVSKSYWVYLKCNNANKISLFCFYKKILSFLALTKEGSFLLSFSLRSSGELAASTSNLSLGGLAVPQSWVSTHLTGAD